MRVSTRWLPFADAATEELPLGRLLRLGLFQVTVGAAITLLTGTLNRVMIVELGLGASVVGWMLALPLFVAPFRALIGHRSDNYRSVLGWRRVPYLWFGTMMTWGGFAIMPFGLILLSGDTRGTHGEAVAIAAFAFLLVGAGIHTTQTAGLALATDLAPERVSRASSRCCTSCCWSARSSARSPSGSCSATSARCGWCRSSRAPRSSRWR